MKKAYLIGPAYPAPYQIAAPANDVNNWYSTLRYYRGYTSIAMLTGSSANRSAILAGLRAHVLSLGSTDHSTIVLSGHGARVADVSGDESDGYDECFVSSDLKAITDDEIGSILALAAPGATIDFVSEFCYAGTSTRGIDDTDDDAPKIDMNIKPIKFTGKLRPTHPHKSKPKATLCDIIPANLNHRLWAAGAPGEISYEVLSSGLWYSIFSLFLCWALRAYPAANATDLMEVAAYYVEYYISQQHPQLEGSNLGAIPF